MKDIPGYEGLYSATTDGEIVSLITTRTRRRGMIKPFVNTGGYLRVNLYRGGKQTKHYVHRLVAATYLPNPEKYGCVNHIDANRQNNRVDNLEWCTPKYNVGFSHRLGNQAKDIPVKALNILTGEERRYSMLKDAGIDLFGTYYILYYHWQKHGSGFTYGPWKFEVKK
jgi:hypothetical protein